jgi:hypothetical protein
VLTDYAAMEAYKGDTLASLFRSMEIVAHFPKQVIVLKATSIICGLTGREAASQESAVTKLPELAEARDTFLFRYALCTYVLILKAIEGGVVKKNPEKLRNTMVDANFATFPTYFDGLMTRDKTASEIYVDAEFSLREIFARPPAWLSWLLRPLRRKW